MKIFNFPTPIKLKSNFLVPDVVLTRFIKTWLNMYGIFVGEPFTNIEVKYNDYHDCIRIELFEIKGNGKNSKSHFDKTLNLLKSVYPNNKITTQHSWRWDTWRSDNNIMIDGICIDFFLEENTKNN